MVDQPTLDTIVVVAEMAATAGLIVTGHVYALRSRVRQYKASGLLQQLAPQPEQATTAPRRAEPRPTDDPKIREEGDDLVEFRQVGDTDFRLYDTRYKRVELNGRIGKGLTSEDYTALVAYLDKNARRIHPREEPHWLHYHERSYLLQGVAVTVPEPLGMVRVEGLPPAVDYVVGQLMADHTFLKRPREVKAK